MYLNRIKNLIITFFVILAVYQTAGLWFEDFSGYGFFYSFFLDGADSSQKEVKYNLESIIINKGNNEFVKKSNDIYDSIYKTAFDNAITAALKKGSFKSQGNVAWESVLSSKCVIYNFGYTLESKELKTMYNAKKSIYSKIGSFNTVIITPDMNVPESMRVSFINTDENTAYTVVLEENDTIEEAYSAMTLLAAEENDIYYISSVQNGFELFKNNVFIPKWNEAAAAYPFVAVSNPFEKDGGVLLMNLEKDIDLFFENPAVKWTSTVNDIYTYSDENTVVKYYTTGVLEYSSYKSAGGSKPDFSKDYLTALSFLNKDVNIGNEYYLSECKQDNEKIVFCFDYKINEHSIKLSEDIKKETGMNNMIELTVSGGKVIRYKRLVYEFNLAGANEEYATADVDFLSAVDRVYEDISELDVEESRIDKIELCYNAVKPGEYAALSWFINIDGKTYVVDAKS